MTHDNRFILSEKDREEWKEGLEHADEMKAIRAPVPMPIPEPVKVRIVEPVRKRKTREERYNDFLAREHMKKVNERQ